MQSRSGGMTQSACATPTHSDASADTPTRDMTRRLDAGPGSAMSPGYAGGRTSTCPRDRGRQGQAPAADHPQGYWVGGDLAAGADGAAVRAGHAGGEDRRGHVHHRGPRAGCDPQLQHRRLRGALPEVHGRPAQNVHPCPSGARSRRSPSRSRPSTASPFSTWSLAKLADFLVAEGWSTTSATRAFASCSARKASPFNA
jgi:hypothetical protein